MIVRLVTIVAAAGAVATWCAAPAGAEGFVDFTSPSGNVGCVLDVDYVRCDIADRDWAPPARPADCEFDYGQGIALEPGGRAGFVCAGDTTLGGSHPLGYGQSIVRGELRCDSAETGITCLDRTTGHGFALSRQVYQLF
ncbi:hypothetical protein L2K20_04245 [Mycobacterium sp. MBM]|nr:hypothetical protein [Mycobacterium sp. MBM]